MINFHYSLPDTPMVNWSFLGGEMPKALSFLRASSGSRINASGFIKMADDGTARFDYNPITLEPLGLLLEKQSTNYITHSIMAGSSPYPSGWTSYYGDGGVPVASHYGEDSTAWGFIAKANRHFVAYPFILTANTTYTFSALVESNENEISQYNLILPSNLVTGAIVSWPKGSAHIPVAGERIYVRIEIKETAGSCQLRIGAGCAANVTGYAALSRPQLEKSLFPTSYILTSGSVSSRKSDYLFQTEAPWLNPLHGTFLIEAAFVNLNIGYNSIFDINANGTLNTNSIAANVSSNREYIANAFVNGSNKYTFSHIGGPSIGEPFKLAMIYQEGAYRFSVNGQMEDSGSILTAGVPTGLSSIAFAHSPRSSPKNTSSIHLRKFMYWNRALTGQEIERITG